MGVAYGGWAVEETAAVVELMNRASEIDRFAVEQVREALVADPDRDPAMLHAAWDGGAIVGAIVGEARKARGQAGDASPIGYVKLLAVAPERQREGIDTRLLDGLEAQLRAAGCRTIRIFADAPTYLRTGVDALSTPMACFFERRRYKRPRAAVNMCVDLAQAPLETTADERRLAQAGYEVRRLTEPDRAAFESYMRDRWSWSWLMETGRSLTRDPVSTHVALRDGSFVGFATHSVSGPGQFGPMGTATEQRGVGIGAVLLKRCLTDLRNEGRAEAEIEWVGPIGFYARHVGATLSRTFLQFEKSLEAST